jgi:hypothetical protein
MRILRGVRFSTIAVAGIVSGFIFAGASPSTVFAASTVVQDNVKAFVACRNTTPGDYCDAIRAYVFVDPMISVQHQATVTDSSGLVIPPGGSVSCGEQVIIQRANNNTPPLAPTGATITSTAL